MKTLLLAFIFSISAISAKAQISADSTANPTSKFYVGIELSSMQYFMSAPAKNTGGGIVPIFHAHVGYKLTKRTYLQAGIAYGGIREDRLSGIYYREDGEVIYDYHKSKKKGVAIPLTLQFNPFNPYRRLRLSAMATVAPTIGSFTHQYYEEHEGERNITYEIGDAGVYVIATAGLQLNYSFSKRFDALVKANLINKEIGKPSGGYPKSVGIGLNYNL